MLTVKSKGATYAVTLTGDLDGLDVAISRDGQPLALGVYDAGGLDCGDRDNAKIPTGAFEKIHSAIEELLAELEAEDEDEEEV
ncbi:MAG: hypothetical protein M3Q55_09290 [Acidobacteriota bacterium]|nr:hypothetical protein [Acidobacteriota bacterium]